MTRPESAPTHDYADDEEPRDEIEEAMMDCHQFVGADGYLYCGAIGSEDCDECPFYRDLGKRVQSVAK